MLNLLGADIGATWYLEFEANFIIWLQNLGGKGSFLYYLMNFITMFGEEIILVGVMGTLYWGIDKRGGERVGAIMLSATVANPLIKNIVCRTRPFDALPDEIQNLRDVDGYSFPSGHSSGSSSLFVGAATVYRKKKFKWLTAIAIVIPLLVALSRNYLGAHWLTDVIAGLVLGVGIAFGVNALFEIFNKYIVYAVLLVVGACGMFYCHTSDYFTGYGLMLGFAPAILFEERIVKFENTRSWWRIVLRVAFGGVLYLGLNTLIKLPFNNMIFDVNGNIKDDMVVFERIFRTIRYAIVSFAAIGVYPLLFKPMEKLWRKIGLIKNK
ncbi:MAG: phosphatase PAP2 family protein [Corallococcus sp.]|nr:phosphatase PAP2 family protein [Corallococcus sp.]